MRAGDSGAAAGRGESAEAGQGAAGGPAAVSAAGGAGGGGAAGPAACIFDLDGTLVDSEPNYEASDRAFLAGWGIVYDEELNRAVMGRGIKEALAIFESRFPASPYHALPVAERIRLKDEAYLAYARGRTRAFPSMLALARGLSLRGFPLAVASGSSPEVIALCLSEAGYDGLFCAEVSAAEVPRGKPAPDVFLEAARRLGTPPGRCLVFEDTLVGLEAARAAGMACVLLPMPGQGERPGEEAALRVFRGGPEAASLPELLALAEGFAASLAAESVRA